MLDEKVRMRGLARIASSHLLQVFSKTWENLRKIGSIDSGASAHMRCHESYFKNLEKTERSRGWGQNTFSDILSG